MSDSDIEKAVKEAAEYEAQDKKKKDAIDTRNEADSMVFQTEKALEEVGDKIDANDRSLQAEHDCIRQIMIMQSICEAADIMEQTIRKYGFEPHREANNIWIIDPHYAESRPTLLLNAHIDTVKPVASWTRDH